MSPHEMEVKNVRTHQLAEPSKRLAMGPMSEIPEYEDWLSRAGRLVLQRYLSRKQGPFSAVPEAESGCASARLPYESWA